MSYGSGTIFLAWGGEETGAGPGGTALTDPGLDHVSLPVELKEGRVLLKLGLPLGGSFLQV